MCTNLLIKPETGGIVVGRTMENALNIGEFLFFRSDKYKYHQKLIPFGEFKLDQKVMEKASVDWVGKFGFVAMEAQQTGLAANGMNTEGLTTGDMTLVATAYQSVDTITGKEQKVILYPYLVNWILSTYKTCEEVSKGLENDIKVVNPYTNMDAALLFHFPVTDATGASIVVEYVNGEVQIHDNSIPGKPGVLTNDPLFDWQLDNLKNYASITPVNTGNNKKLTNNFNTTNPWQGTGFEGLPGSSTPPDRFVRAAMMTNYAYPVDNLRDATTLAFHILNTVDIPHGTSRVSEEEKVQLGDKEAGDYTLWASVSNLTERIYSVRVYGSPQVFSVDLKNIDLSESGGMNEVEYNLPHDWPTSIDLTDTLKELSKEEKDS